MFYWITTEGGVLSSYHFELFNLRLLFLLTHQLVLFNLGITGTGENSRKIPAKIPGENSGDSIFY